MKGICVTRYVEELKKEPVRGIDRSHKHPDHTQKVAAVPASSEKVASRHSNEDSCKDGGKHKGTQHALNEDGVLDLSQRGLLDPDLPVEDLADDIALLVLDDPRLLLVAVRRAEAVKGALAQLLEVVLRQEQLPGPNVTVVQSVKYNAHALVAGDQRGNTDHEGDGGQSAVAASGAGEGQNEGNHDSDQYSGNAEALCEGDPGWVAIADGPPDEIWVSLATQRCLNRLGNDAEC
jgi:hypothetical protein